MKYSLFALFVCLILTCAYCDEKELAKKIDSLVNEIASLKGSSFSIFFELPEDKSPIITLQKLGMPAIPYLVPYLADPRITESFWSNRRTKEIIKIRVNEFIGNVINRVAERRFYLEIENNEKIILENPLTDPKQIKEFQDQVLAWWKRNRDKSPLERKIEDVHDSFHSNRFNAYNWIGENKAIEGKAVLQTRIDELLKGGANSLKEGEMVICAKNLALIDGRESEIYYRKITEYLLKWINNIYGPLRSVGYEGQFRNLFQAYYIWASVGMKEEAIQQLHDLKDKYLDKMKERTREEFLELLEKAEKW